MNNEQSHNTCRTMRVDECAAILGIGRSAMYQMVRTACETGMPVPRSPSGRQLSRIA